MELKQALSNEVTGNPGTNDHTNTSEVCWCRGVGNLTSMQDLVALFQSSVRKEVEELKGLLLTHLPSLQNSDLPTTSRSSPDQVEPSTVRSLCLQFVSPLPNVLFTLTNIQDEGISVKVELRDNYETKIEFGPESCARVEIFVLHGHLDVEGTDECIEEAFNRHVVQPREGKPPLLLGTCEVSMSKGVAVFSDVQFTDNSMRSNFRLGARVVKGLPAGVSVRGAVSNPFKVKVCRLRSHRKHETPELEDDVWRLNNIAKNGPVCQRLEKEKIYTVKDFLQLYHTDARKLRSILRLSEKRWPKTIRNAESCLVNNEGYRYYDDASRVDLLLDCVFNIESVTFEGQSSQPYGMLDDYQKEFANKLRILAYEKRSELEKVYVSTNQKSAQAGTVCSASIPVMYANVHNLDAAAANLGWNVDLPIPTPYSSDNGYELGPDLYTENWLTDPWDEVGGLTQLLDERSAAEPEVSTKKNVTSKVKAACYVTKAAILFMVSVEQDHNTSRKKQKL